MMMKNPATSDIMNSCNPVLADCPPKEDSDMQRQSDNNITALYMKDPVTKSGGWWTRKPQ